MWSFEALPIKRKLMLVIMLTSLTALLLACAGFALYELVTVRRLMVGDLTTLADVIGATSTAALIFEDTKAATEFLGALKTKPHIVVACFYTKYGRFFAGYSRDGGETECLAAPSQSGYRFEQGYLLLSQPVVEKGAPIGTLYLKSDLQPMKARFGPYLWIVLLVLVTSVAGAFVLAEVLQWRISAPILTLAMTAKMVSESKDYTVRAMVHTRDELGLLAEAFNAMLSQIQARDVALRKMNEELEQRVQERTAELRAANRELEAFSYSVSHDLRAPLRAITGFSRILLEDYAPQLPNEAQHYLKIVDNGGQHMGQLIDDLLAFSRLGRMELRKQRVATTDLVRQVLADLQAEQSGREVEITLGDLRPCRAEPSLLKQVFVNLLSNALKYSRKREVAHIVVGCREHDGEQVYFVKDNGVGFDMQYAKKLFGVFQRLHRAEEYEGTGVGLAIVQRIVHRHGGRVWAEAALDRGATFYFTLEGGPPRA
ncbi:MAG: ATP-binding protein [Candidatus Entotheonellia bacterium]